MKRIIWAGVAAFVIDQISKFVMLHWLDLSRIRSIDVFPPLLNFRYGENRGINFGLFGDGDEVMRWVLTGFAIIVVLAILVWMRRGNRDWKMQICAGLLIGGALGNVLDRLIYGYVIDFLNMSCCGLNNPFVFNLADVFIFVGAIGLVWFDHHASKGDGIKNAS